MRVKEFKIYFNTLSTDLAGVLLITGKPEFLLAGTEKLERFYMQAAAVVDDLSLKVMVGGTEDGVTQHLNQWHDVQKELGFGG